MTCLLKYLDAAHPSHQEQHLGLYDNTTGAPSCISVKWRVLPASIVLRSVPPLAEDHVHGLGQVVHGAVSRHSWVPLIAGPEGRRGKKHTLKYTQHRKKQEQTVATQGSVNKKQQQFDAISHINNTDCIHWKRAGHDGLRRVRKGKAHTEPSRITLQAVL